MCMETFEQVSAEAAETEPVASRTEREKEAIAEIATAYSALPGRVEEALQERFAHQ